ncbi:MAG: hypothetical protein U0930_05055 [Pirellulales bacterium]
MSSFTLDAPGQSTEAPVVVESAQTNQAELTESNETSTTTAATNETTSEETASPEGNSNIIETDKEHELLDSLFESYMRYLKASREQAKATKAFREAEDALKLAKDETLGAKEMFDEILASLPQELVRLRAPDLSDMVEAVVVEQVASAPAMEPAIEPSSTDITDSQYQAWLEIPTAKVIEGIPRLGETKAEKLIEQFPTIRELEAARAEAQQSHQHFSVKLPTGCGKSIADAIVDKMQSMLKLSTPSVQSTPSSSDTENQLNEASDLADAIIDGTNSDSEVDELEYEDYDPETSRNALASGSNVELDKESEQQTALDVLEQIYEELIGSEDEILANWGLTDNTTKKNEDWKQGFTAHKDGFQYTDCPETEPEIIRQWLRGWIAFDYAI